MQVLNLVLYLKKKVSQMLNVNFNICLTQKSIGYSYFISWKDITDEAKGYIKNDRVFFQVSLVYYLYLSYVLLFLFCICFYLLGLNV